MLMFQGLKYRRFQRGFHWVSLHHPTVVHLHGVAAHVDFDSKF